MGDRCVTAAVAAAVEVGNRFHLPTEFPEVLATHSNVLVRLGAVVARVPATTLVARPGVLPSLAREVALSSFLGRKDAPVIPPFESPGPHLAAGLPVTLWRFTRHDPDHLFSPAEVAWSLAELHAALREFPGELDAPGPLAEARSWIERLDLPAELLDEVAEVEADLPVVRVRALHGDAHAGNLLATGSGPRWLDFEDTWAGPVAWDLACLAGSARLDGRAAVAAYPDAPSPDELAPWMRLRGLFGVCWRFVIAHRFPERLPEAWAELRGFKTVGGWRQRSRHGWTAESGRIARRAQAVRAPARCPRSGSGSGHGSPSHPALRDQPSPVSTVKPPGLRRTATTRGSTR
ncbi:aminoglycoside phosphotransferase family protein [Amycolatopsis endophytica]|uniref:Aminoglycoside phosphotransferase domain-containing protein n=1 Tax=Amycolatopsis endophytica TaxID=860233 RepID=A0A853AWZ5_9PSEU|nr:phosphotransferase [Amycolatopsis endophytica]NYI87116.1 hypothetical protein [Amycolatopsis endophytica]